MGETTTQVCGLKDSRVKQQRSLLMMLSPVPVWKPTLQWRSACLAAQLGL